LRYDDALYRRADFTWIRRNFACCFVMLCDETFYGPKQGWFTVESFLEHGQREFGGYDSLVLWHAYPRIGFDERNQFDFYRDQPGGLAGLRELSRVCHGRGVRVFIDYNPWDTGTRREGKPDLDALAELVGAIEADGIFLDTMSKGAGEFRAKLDAARPGVILEGEGALPLENIHDHHASWAQWFNDSAAPGVLRNKWFERRHLQHQIKRWERDHSGELHCAWMNGSGMMVWENVFGSWVGWSERDRSILRAMLPIQRRHAELFCGERWTPPVPTLKPDVFASLWEAPRLRLWTLVNRSSKEQQGALLQVQPIVGERFFDLIAGGEVFPAEESAAPFGVRLAIPGRGIGCVLAGKGEALGADFDQFLADQRRLQARAILDAKFPARQVQLRPVQPTPRATAVPEGMVEVPAASLTMQVEFQVRECGFYGSVPDPGPDWGPLHRPKLFTREVKLAPFAIDITPVTNAQFSRFLKAAGYKPRHPENFLKHWQGGAPPPGREEHPVVFVSLEDARAYAAWAGKRLPTEEEWQYAAAGPGQRLYPWGDSMRPGVCNDGKSGGTTAVKAFPEGRSPFGCYDLCGNVWHWTESERSDGRTRFCILKGGSWFKARGSGWYADGGPVPCRFAAKFLLMWPGLDRCSTIGFRCVVDLAS
jgi:formylglycine-generating enzyme required for sulfatase activity